MNFDSYLKTLLHLLHGIVNVALFKLQNKVKLKEIWTIKTLLLFCMYIPTLF